MEKLNRDQILSLPNGVSVIRVLAIPFILIMLFSPGKVAHFVTALLFLAAAITDTLDGYLARRRGMVTTLGKFLDPLADKLLIVTALIALAVTRQAGWALSIGIADVVVKIAAYYVHERLWDRIPFGRGKSPDYQI